MDSLPIDKHIVRHRRFSSDALIVPTDFRPIAVPNASSSGSADHMAGYPWGPASNVTEAMRRSQFGAGHEGASLKEQETWAGSTRPEYELPAAIQQEQRSVEVRSSSGEQEAFDTDSSMLGEMMDGAFSNRGRRRSSVAPEAAFISTDEDPTQLDDALPRRTPLEMLRRLRSGSIHNADEHDDEMLATPATLAGTAMPSPTSLITVKEPNECIDQRLEQESRRDKDGPAVPSRFGPVGHGRSSSGSWAAAAQRRRSLDYGTPKLFSAPSSQTVFQFPYSTSPALVSEWPAEPARFAPGVGYGTGMSYATAVMRRLTYLYHALFAGLTRCRILAQINSLLTSFLLCS